MWPFKRKNKIKLLKEGSPEEILSRIPRIEAQIERLEKKVFGFVNRLSVRKKEQKEQCEKRVYLSRAGIRQFPTLKNKIFYFVRWHRDDPDLMLIRKEGQKSLNYFHKSFFQFKPLGMSEKN